MRSSKPSLIVIAIACLACFAGTPQLFGQNLVSNGSFETGDFTGWTTGGNFEFTRVTSGPFSQYSGAQDGMYYAYLGPVGSDGTLSQTFATTNGAIYTLSFWFAAVGDEPSDFSVYWDGTPLLNLANPNTGSNWMQFSALVTATGNDTLLFSFRDDPAYMALDNISVGACCSTAPEPSSWILLVTGALALGKLAWRRG